MTNINIPGDFFTQLQAKYEKDPNLKDSWVWEGPILKEIFSRIAEKISFNYDLIEPLKAGGGGVVAIVFDRNLETKRALKVSRPSQDKDRLLASILLKETKSLKRLSHTNLIRIYAQGAIKFEKPSSKETSGEPDETGAKDDTSNIYPYYVMEFIDNVKDSDEYLASATITQTDVLRIFSGIVSAVSYMHSQDTIHMDLKPGNIFISPDGTPIIIDLGFAKHLKVSNSLTLIGGTEGYIHPKARELIRDLGKEKPTDPNRVRGDVGHDALKKSWDLFPLGKTFLDLLKALDEKKEKVLTPYARRYLRLLACRLLDGYNTENERAIGLSISTLREIKYLTIDQVKIDLEKITGEYNLAVRIPELNLHIQDTIQTSTLAVTPFTKRLSQLLAHPALMRLGNCTQLGLLNLVYPTATHSRLEHSIGTFSVLCRFILALYNDPLNPLFCQIIWTKKIYGQFLLQRYSMMLGNMLWPMIWRRQTIPSFLTRNSASLF